MEIIKPQLCWLTLPSLFSIDKTESKDNFQFFLISEGSTGYSGSVVSGANWNFCDFFIVGAVYAESVVCAVWVDVCAFGCKFLAADAGSVVHGAYCDAFYVSSVFKVRTIFAAFYLRSITSTTKLSGRFSAISPSPNNSAHT
jgi:hypothetical protein